MKNKIIICNGVGLNQIFPDYVTIEIPKKETELDPEMVYVVKKLEDKKEK